MGKQVIKQPDGKFAIFSTTSDMFIALDLSREEVISYYVSRATTEAMQGATQLVDEVDAGKPAYFQFTLTWKQACEINRKNNGPKT